MERKERRTAESSSTEAQLRFTLEAFETPRRPEAASSSSRPRSTPSAAKTLTRMLDAASAESTVVNPHELAHSVSRRSGRAVIAPLKWWENERKVNGVVVQGPHVNVDEYQEALSAKERGDRERRGREDGGDDEGR